MSIPHARRLQAAGDHDRLEVVAALVMTGGGANTDVNEIDYLAALTAGNPELGDTAYAALIAPKTRKR